MKKNEILDKIVESKIVAVVRAENKESALTIIDGLIKGGIKAIEVTFTVNHADDIISELSDKYPNLLIGAGTVLDEVTARIAILKGASFIVSPSFNSETAKLCFRYQIPYLPGCYTINEILTALEAGCDIIKLFPGSLSGPSYVKSILGPLPYANIMPTGGVSLSNIKEWFDNKVVAVGIGGELTKVDKDSKVSVETQISENVKKYFYQIRGVVNE
jgi:2-dehydro-3-deoxyphosphogluconate aldolase/(4S)-4-hydroxy-2-oxoglutarate aldolase